MAAKNDNRTQFKPYKEDVQRRGKPFFPYAMFHDTVMSLIVVTVIVALACVWFFTARWSKNEPQAWPRRRRLVMS